MLFVISPAKRLDVAPQSQTRQYTTPDFLRESRQLIKRLREFSPQGLSELMDISDSLAEENHARFRQWKTPFTPENAKPAILTFQGDVYLGMEAASFRARDLQYAQKHLRILSGLYGVLRPLDLIQPYRLEMGTALSTSRGDNLYAFWGDKITKAVQSELDEQPDRILVNLASNEYFQSIRNSQLDARIITPVFKETKNGKHRVLSFFAKKARGQMVAFAVRQRLKSADELKRFDVEGYRYEESLSSEDQWVFARPQP